MPCKMRRMMLMAASCPSDGLLTFTAAHAAKCLHVVVGRKIIKNSQAQSAHQNQCDIQLWKFKDIGQQKSSHQYEANEAGSSLQGFHAMFLLINSETSHREERSKRASFW